MLWLAPHVDCAQRNQYSGFCRALLHRAHYDAVRTIALREIAGGNHLRLDRRVRRIAVIGVHSLSSTGRTHSTSIAH
jgi:hypothetical protein